MRQHDLSTPARRRRRLGTWALLGALMAALLGGCASGELRGNASTGWLPPAITESGKTVTTLWIGAWIALIMAAGLGWSGLRVTPSAQASPLFPRREILTGLAGVLLVVAPVWAGQSRALMLWPRAI